MVAGISSAGNIDLNGVIDDQVNRAKRVNLGWVATETLHSVTHGSQIDDGGDTTKKYKFSKIFKNGLYL